MTAEPVPDLGQTIRAIRREMRDEYTQAHAVPWIVGFSGGKDSTLLLQLVFEAILATPPSERRRPVYIISNDTRVESPIVVAYTTRILERVSAGVAALGLPMSVVRTQPLLDETFWVNLLGRGYPAPNRNFRWCTDRMKIRPTSRFILETVSSNGEAILLLGARRSESVARARVVARYSGAGRLNPHNDVRNCLVYRPIVDLRDEDVWQTLLACRPPWGGTHRDLVTLYKNAQGECPFVTSDDDAPSCGTTSVRLGCWTCTVVQKDNAMAGLIDAGFENLEPLYAYRDRLKNVSSHPDYRSKTRRNGAHGLGPLTLEARRMLLAELLQAQEESGLPLIAPDEVHRIRAIWQEDQITDALRDLAVLEEQAIA